MVGIFFLPQESLAYSSFGFRFSSLFVEALPTEYFQRVWDIFLSEGACDSRVFPYPQVADVLAPLQAWYFSFVLVLQS